MPRPSCAATASICGRRKCATYEAWADLRAQSRAFLTPWEPTWPGDDLTYASFRRRVRRNHQEIANDEAYPFLVFRDDDVLAGGLTLGQVKRGVVQAATLGYWIGAPYARQGLMSAAVRAVTGYAFAHTALAPDRSVLLAA